VVVGPSEAALDATSFLARLSSRRRGSYTVRTYALGLAHFLSWLDDQAGASLNEIDRTTLARYVTAFADGDGDRPLGRKPRTVNHRLSVLASFFAFLIERDTGAWAQRGSPVPAEPGAMLGTQG
jgi:site-specific recombinase XerD